jgi:hypothetical protein
VISNFRGRTKDKKSTLNTLEKAQNSYRIPCNRKILQLNLHLTKRTLGIFLTQLQHYKENAPGKSILFSGKENNAGNKGK